MKKYFVSFGFDFFFLSGITILTWVLAYVFFHGDRMPMVYQISGLLTWFINWPHFSMTSYRLYHRREFSSQYPMTSVLVPVLAVISTVFGFLNPGSFGVIWIMLYMVWSPYHFSGQTLGLSLLYARRGGIEVSRSQRFFLSSFIYCTFIVMTARANIGEGEFTYYGIHYPKFGLPYQFVDLLWVWQCVSGVGLIVSFFPHLRQWRTFPFFVFLLPATQAFWFLLGPKFAGFNEFVPALHSLQYMFIAWMLQLSEKSPRPSQESIKWYGLNIVGGALLFHFVPTLGEKYGLPVGVAWGLIIASVQIHHFFVDGVIWKLKDSKIRNPLMGNVSEWKLS